MADGAIPVTSATVAADADTGGLALVTSAALPSRVEGVRGPGPGYQVLRTIMGRQASIPSAALLPTFALSQAPVHLIPRSTVGTQSSGMSASAHHSGGAGSTGVKAARCLPGIGGSSSTTCAWRATTASFVTLITVRSWVWTTGPS
jgi:hypothetical protein